MPLWADTLHVACFDARGFGNRLWAVVVPERINRESLLAFAGLQSETNVEIYVGSSWVPLRPGELADTQPGVLITFMPGTALYRPGPSLQLMLLSADNWARDPFILAGPEGRYFFLLTDGGSFRAEVANALRYDLEHTSMQAAIPPVNDFLHQGIECEKVVIFTEAVSRVPIPPGRLLPPQTLVLLDQRAILRGFDWVMS